MTPTTSTPTNAATNPTNLTTSPTSTAGTPKATVTPGSLSSSSQDKDAILSTKCSRRGCKDNSSLPTIECGYEKCTRRIHMACFQQLYGSKGYKKLGAGIVVCTKKCYDRQVILSQSTRNPCWQTDGALGRQDPQNSEQLLLTWLMTKPNYRRFRGKGNNGKTKKQFAEDIASLFNDSGVTVKRDAKQVLNKIKHMESLFWKAHDFANCKTGVGIQES